MLLEADMMEVEEEPGALAVGKLVLGGILQPRLGCQRKGRFLEGAEEQQGWPLI